MHRRRSGKDDDSVRIDQGSDLFCGLQCIVILDHEQDYIHWSDLGGVICYLCRINGEVSQWAQHFQTIFPDDVQMGTSGDEADIKTCLGQSSSKITSDGACAHYGNFHVSFP